jgi:hypothetical protein
MQVHFIKRTCKLIYKANYQINVTLNSIYIYYKSYHDSRLYFVNSLAIELPAPSSCDPYLKNCTIL